MYIIIMTHFSDDVIEIVYYGKKQIVRSIGSDGMGLSSRRARLQSTEKVECKQRFALTLSSHLMYGVARVYSKQLQYLLCKLWSKTMSNLLSEPVVKITSF